MKDGKCMLTTCPQGHFRGWGDCISCDDLGKFRSTECNRCPNRIEMDNLCVLKDCPDGFIHNDLNDVCVSCDDEVSINSFDCDHCPNRLQKGEKCILKECPDGYFHNDNNGDCVPCHDERVVHSSDCERCSNREYKDGYCFPEGSSKTSFLSDG